MNKIIIIIAMLLFVAKTDIEDSLYPSKGWGECRQEYELKCKLDEIQEHYTILNDHRDVIKLRTLEKKRDNFKSK